MNKNTGQETRAVWAGEEEYLLGASQVPVVLSAAFGYRDMDEWLNVATGKSEGNHGAVETIVPPPATSSHVECSPEERARLGIPEGLIRYSTGIEDIEDLIDDLAEAHTRFQRSKKTRTRERVISDSTSAGQTLRSWRFFFRFPVDPN